MDTATIEDIRRLDDGTLVVTTAASVPVEEADDEVEAGPGTKVLHPGEGGYDEALMFWDEQQNPDRPAVVSTASGREQAMTVVHAVSEEDVPVEAAVAQVDDPQASGDALRHVLVGGVHSVEDFAKEVAAAEGGDPLPPHKATKIIGEVLAEVDKAT